jgi:hypothetical protein
MTTERQVSGGHDTPPAINLSAADQQLLHREDVAGGRAIVGLMGGIFIVGLFLYLFVAWWVS